MIILNQINYPSGRSIKALLLVLMFISIPCLVMADGLDDKVEKLRSHACIDWHQVSAPTGHLLLAKRGTEVCAIKFLKFDRGRIDEPYSWSYSGGETFTAEYEWRCFTVSGIANKLLKTHSGNGKLIRKPYHGIPLTHIGLQFPKDRIKFSTFKLFWMYPTSVSFEDTPRCSDNSVELAPTKLTDFEAVYTVTQNVKWYKCDEHRKTVYIPLDEL